MTNLEWMQKLSIDEMIDFLSEVQQQEHEEEIKQEIINFHKNWWRLWLLEKHYEK